VKVSASGGGPL
jgi:hypothetical protein